MVLTVPVEHNDSEFRFESPISILELNNFSDYWIWLILRSLSVRSVVHKNQLIESVGPIVCILSRLQFLYLAVFTTGNTKFW